MHWLQELQQRNQLLCFFGWLCFFSGIICSILTQTSTIQVNNISAFFKPMKFFFSAWIFCWTMAWLLFELQNKSVTTNYSIMIVIVMVIELGIITWQAANGRLSHFNISKPVYSALFSFMGVAIVLLTVWTLFIGQQFFTLKNHSISLAYLWGIRLGILLFVIFSFEGGIMAAQLKHTVGANDGNKGIPILDWSKQHGDLRVAHFLGIHALQILPLAGYYLFKSTTGIVVFAVVYFIITSFLLLQALKGVPFMGRN